MSNRNSNFPSAQQNSLNGTEWTGECVHSLMDLAGSGKPQNESELENRINDFFLYCANSRIRPGIEALALSLGVTRQCLWNWSNGIHSPSERWTQLCEQARQLVLTFTEQAGLNGHVAPPSFIFLMKNLGNYKDVVSFQETLPVDVERHRTPAEIAARHNIVFGSEAAGELPRATFIDGGKQNEE